MSAPALRARIVLRPRSQDEVFDLAVAYLRAHARDFRGLLLVAVLGPCAIGLGAGLGLELAGLDEALASSAAVLAFLAAGIVGERMLTQLVGRHLFERPARLRDTWRRALAGPHRWLPRALGLWALWPIFAYLSEDPEALVGALFIWMMFGGLFGLLATRRPHQSEVELLEQLRGSAARRRASDLSRYRQGRSLGFAVQALLLRALFAATLIGATYTIFEFTLQFENVMTVLGPISAALGFAAAGPYLALARLFEYVDARTRGEGWDLQVRFQDIAERERLEREGRAA